MTHTSVSSANSFANSPGDFRPDPYSVPQVSPDCSSRDARYRFSPHQVANSRRLDWSVVAVVLEAAQHSSEKPRAVVALLAQYHQIELGSMVPSSRSKAVHMISQALDNSIDHRQRSDQLRRPLDELTSVPTSLSPAHEPWHSERACSQSNDVIGSSITHALAAPSRPRWCCHKATSMELKSTKCSFLRRWAFSGYGTYAGSTLCAAVLEK